MVQNQIFPGNAMARRNARDCRGGDYGEGAVVCRSWRKIDRQNGGENLARQHLASEGRRIQTLRAFRQAWKSELAEKHYCILFYMSLVGSVGIVGMDDLF